MDGAARLDASTAPAGSAPSPDASDGTKQVAEPPGSTRGTIACGTSRCDAKRQVCALEGGAWRCVDGRDPNRSGSTLYCDDGTDCGPGLTCCQTGASAEFVVECTKRHGPESNCALEVCRADGARCPRDTHCEDDYCVTNFGPTCPGAGKPSCAPGEFCVWKAGVTACVGEYKEQEEPAETRGVFLCTRPRDCGQGNQCCLRYGRVESERSESEGLFELRGSCATNCDITNSTLVCETVADCKPKLGLVPPHMRHLAKLACKTKESTGPTWLKGCELDLP